MSQNVNVNLVPGNYPKEFHVSQYDVGRQLVANIVDSTGAYSIPSGATVTLVGTKPSGFGFTLSGSVGSGGVVTFSTTATVTAEYGRIPCEIRIESGNTVLGTANCMLIVEMSPHPEGTTDGDGEVIVNQITLLLEQITQQADRAEDAKDDAKASELAAEGYAVGKQNGTEVGPESPYYHNNCKWYGAQFDEALKDYAKIDGYYKDMTVGTAKQLLSDSTTTDSEPYIYRQTAGDGDREEVEVVGGTVAWNQLCNSASVTVPNGHKYYMIKGGTASIGASTGTAITGLTSGTDIVTDLTAMFGPQVADAVYAMEQASAGAGVAWFRKLFNKSYYPYNKGELMSVKTSGHVTVGKNLIPLPTKRGYWAAADGSFVPENNWMSTEKINVLPNTQYHVSCSFLGRWTGIVAYDADGNFVGNIGESASHAIRATDLTVTALPNCYAVGISIAGASGTTPMPSEVTDLQFELGNVSTDYEPYSAHTYPFSPIDLRGIPKWVDGRLKFDGDVYKADGTVTRNTVYRAYQSGDESLANAITDGSHTVVYSANASTETADPYTAIQVCDPNGTEEWTDERTVQIPVGNVTIYHSNLKEKLEDLPAIPTAPSANGTYTLKATVSGGAVTYQWVNG